MLRYFVDFEEPTDRIIKPVATTTNLTLTIKDRGYTAVKIGNINFERDQYGWTFAFDQVLQAALTGTYVYDNDKIIGWLQLRKDGDGEILVQPEEFQQVEQTELSSSSSVIYNTGKIDHNKCYIVYTYRGFVTMYEYCCYESESNRYMFRKEDDPNTVLYYYPANGYILQDLGGISTTIQCDEQCDVLTGPITNIRSSYFSSFFGGRQDYIPGAIGFKRIRLIETTDYNPATNPFINELVIVKSGTYKGLWFEGVQIL